MEIRDKALQDLIEEYEPFIMSDNRYRSLLSKKFSKENPYSNMMASIFTVASDTDIYDSRFVQNETGHWI
jgi:hypothetical protein